MSAGGRVREVHFGRVVANDDPEKRGGLKIQVDTLLEGATVTDDYIPPSFPFAGNDQGWFFVPEVGNQVEVEVTADPDRAVESLEARWRTVLYSDVDNIPEEFRSNPQQRGGIKFGKSVMLFDKAADVLALVSGNVRLGEEDASHPVVRGDTLNVEMIDKWVVAMETLLTALKLAWTGFTGLTGPLSPIAVIAAPIPPAITAFETATTAFKAAKSSWLSSKVKTE